MAFWSLRLPAQTLRNCQKTMLADSVDFDITHMAVLLLG